MSPPKDKAFILGLSGVSSSGKTTLSRLLRTVFGPSSFILHEDDFFVPEDRLPLVDGVIDCDCPEAIDFPSLMKALRHIHEYGELPGDLESKEDLNAIGESRVTEEEQEEQRRKVVESGVVVKLAILDGFLLFHDEGVLGALDARIFLRTPYEKARQRREARREYVTIEGSKLNADNYGIYLRADLEAMPGFWEDPPGYFDKIVWPNYVKSHKHLFLDGDVTGDLNLELMKTKGIASPKEVDMPMKRFYLGLWIPFSAK